MKFHERFLIELGLEEARGRFVNRAHRLMFYDFWTRQVGSGGRRSSLEAVAFELGDRDLKSTLAQQVGHDFHRNLQALEAFYHSLVDENVEKRQEFERRIQHLLDVSEVDLSIRWEQGQFMPSGAVLLDEKLVNDVLRWLRSSQFDPVRQPFEKGLTHFLHAAQRPELLADVITDMYEALEALAKLVTKRPDKDLSGNREFFISQVNASPEYKQLLKDYIDYANKFRHATKEGTVKPALSPKEVESFIYLTGLFIRLAMP